MPLYFEDAVGNRDTIVVGYDENASFNQLNLQFGEQAITTPFDSIFEVRAVHADDHNFITSKKIIENFELGPGDTCGASAGIRIFVRAKYLPVTIHYDTALVNSSLCHHNMILSPDNLIFLLQYWWDAREYYCMTHTGMVVMDTFTHPFLGGDALRRPFEVEGQGAVELPGYFWVIKYIGICQYMVDTEVPVPATTPITLSPNPVSSTLRVGWPETFSGQVEVFGSAGGQVLLRQMVQQAELTEIDVGPLPGGLYFLSAVAANGQRRVRTFVVLH